MFLGILESPEPVLFTETNAKPRLSNRRLRERLECRSGALLPLSQVYTIRSSYDDDDDHILYSVSQREAIFRTAFRSPESSEKNWEVLFQCPATARNLQHQDLVKIWEDKIMPKSLCGWTQNGARITIWEGFKHRIGMLSLHGNHWKSCPEAGLPRGPI